MIQIKEIVNSIFTSKTYILYQEGGDKAWIVDIGDIEPVVAFLEEKRLQPEGIFLTHGHFDHIYGLSALVAHYPSCKVFTTWPVVTVASGGVAHYPSCKVFTTEYGKQCLASDKLNMSKYHEHPFSYEGDNVIVVHEGDKQTLFESEPEMLFYETPGHNPGCMTMVLGDLIFTGDAYIPEVGVNTQPPHSDKELAKQSLQRIMELAEGRRILSGHQVG